MNIFEDDKISGFILKDILRSNFNIIDITKELMEKNQENHSIHDSKVLQIFTQTVEEEEEKETEE